MPFRIPLIIAFILSFNDQLVYSQTRLGLHYTQEELAIWKQRTASGPYRVKNDFQLNSPGDWQRITSVAKAFLANPFSDKYDNCYQGNGCVPIDIKGTYDPRTVGEHLRDAGFYYLITGDSRYATAVRSGLLAQANDSLTNFANSARWCPGGLGDLNPSFTIAEWLTRLLYGYDYIKATLSEADKTTLNAWFLSAARYLRSNYDPNLDGMFVNRAAGNYSIGQNWMLKKETDPSNGALMYYGGPKARLISRQYNNRRVALAAYVGLAGLFLNDPTLVLSSKRFFKELIMFGIYPTGYYVDFLRGISDKSPDKGYGYATLSGMFVFADALARTGDTELYDWTTKGGTTSATSGEDATSDGVTPKGLRMYIKALLDLRNHVKAIYATSDPALAKDSLYRVDGIDAARGDYSVWDIMYAVPNLYYQDAYIRASYLRTAPGSVPYPVKAQNAGSVQAWTLGEYPGLLLMFGQMEGKVWPYPGKKAPVYRQP